MCPFFFRSNDFSWVDIFGEDEGDSEEPFTPAEGIVSLALTLVKQGYLKSSVQFLAKLSVERKALPRYACSEYSVSLTYKGVTFISYFLLLYSQLKTRILIGNPYWTNAKSYEE